jgi:putative OPT family oligopeptide transporter
MQNRTRNDRELSARSIALGLLLAVIMGASNTYLGLKIGMTITASIPAAVIAIAVLRGILRTGTIFESNLVQTAASVGSDLAAGVIFTLPALVFIGYWQSFDYLTTTLIGLAGGTLGILLMIPMRKVFIIGKYKDLPYPEAHATVAVMKAAYERESEARSGASALIMGTLSAGILQALIAFVGVFKSPLEYAGVLFGRIFYIGGDLSPALVGIGFIVRLTVALQVFFGAFIAWGILLPLLGDGLSVDGSVLDAAWGVWSTKIRYVGVGAMIIGGAVSIYNAKEGLTHALKEIFSRKNGTREKVDMQNRDISPRTILFVTALSILCLAFVFFRATDNVAVTAIAGVVMVVLAFFFTSVANYIVAIVGSSNSPVSGLNIAAVLITGLLLLVFGYSGMSGMVATLSVAAVICCVSSMAGDSCNELKMGHMIGASPFRQQIMLLLGMSASAFCLPLILQLLHDNTPGGIGGRELAAPQAALLASLLKGLFGEGGTLPWGLITVGLGVGVSLIVVDIILSASKSSFRISVISVAVGIYLPATISLPMLFGAVIAKLVSGRARGHEAEERLQKGVLFSSGFIAGESLMGVGIALLASCGLSRLDLGIDPGLQLPLSVVGALLMASAFVWGTKRKCRGKRG